MVLVGKDVKDIYEHTSTLKLFKNKLSTKAKKALQVYEEVSYKKIKDYIARADVVVLPSFAEAFPMTWLEAMAMEKPLVTSDIGWAPEIMEDHVTGYMINPRNHELFADRILTLIGNREKAMYMGRSASKRIEQYFSNEVIVQKNIQLYKTLIGSQS